MTNYAKGASYERELISLLQKKNYAAVRVAGSGKARFEQPDILASNGAKILAFECKYSSTDYKTILKEQVNDFYTFCKKFGCTPVLAFRFPHTEWGFKIVEKESFDNVSVKKQDKFLAISEIT